MTDSLVIPSRFRGPSGSGNGGYVCGRICTAEAHAVAGQMTASVVVLPVAGDQCVVIGWPGGRDGRKLIAGSALLGASSEVLAVVERGLTPPEGPANWTDRRQASPCAA